VRVRWRASEVLQALKKRAVSSDDGLDGHALEIPHAGALDKALARAKVFEVSTTRARRTWHPLGGSTESIVRNPGGAFSNSGPSADPDRDRVRRSAKVSSPMSGIRGVGARALEVICIDALWLECNPSCESGLPHAGASQRPGRMSTNKRTGRVA
jgi:hypothetical protein